MKKFISVLLIGAMIFLTSCSFRSTSEEKGIDLQNNALNSAEEHINFDDLLTEEENEDVYQEEIKEEYIVYRTRTGKKYHSSGCRYLSQSCFEITLENAERRGLKPCYVCQP